MNVNNKKLKDIEMNVICAFEVNCEIRGDINSNFF